MSSRLQHQNAPEISIAALAIRQITGRARSPSRSRQNQARPEWVREPQGLPNQAGGDRPLDAALRHIVEPMQQDDNELEGYIASLPSPKAKPTMLDRLRPDQNEYKPKMPNKENIAIVLATNLHTHTLDSQSSPTPKTKATRNDAKDVHGKRTKASMSCTDVV